MSLPNEAYTCQTGSERQQQVNSLYRRFHDTLKTELPGFNFNSIPGTSHATGKKYEWDLAKERPHIRYYAKYNRWGLAWDLYPDDGSDERFGTSLDVKTDYSVTEFVEIYLNGLQDIFNATHLEIR